MLEKVETKMEILTSRPEHFCNKLVAIDKKIDQFLVNKNMLEIFKKEVFSECAKIVKRIYFVWIKSGVKPKRDLRLIKQKNTTKQTQK